MAGHVFHPTLLREYDIRGVVGKTLTARDASALGQAFGAQLLERGGSSVAVGYDGRLSSPSLEAALVEGLLSVGIDVYRVGLGPTPMLYFADKVLGTGGAIMVTGSHNPADHNGFKLVLGGQTLHGREIKRLGEIARAGVSSRRAGKLADRPVLDAYVERLRQEVAWTSELAVAWDCGNGATGVAMQRLCGHLPGYNVVLNENVDGTFPAHHPDPTLPDTLAQLQAALKTGSCDVGIAFDGDGDRLGVIDDEGQILWGDQILAILAEDVLRASPGATIIADVKASQVLFDEISRLGGEPLMWRAGHSLIKAKMTETGAPLAGEVSGHIFFADRYYGFDDALYAAIRLLNLVCRSPHNLSELRSRLPQRVNTPELRFPCPEARKRAVVSEARARLESAGANVISIDGVRVQTLDGWWLLRASNTEAALGARAEATTAAGLERLVTELAEQLEESGVSSPAIDRLLQPRNGTDRPSAMRSIALA
jgi:phosphomannomutase